MDMRKATLADFETFNQMYTQFFSSDGATHLNRPMPEDKYKDLVDGEGIYLAIVDGEVMGFATLFAYEDVGCKIDNMYIKDKCKGYGTQFYALLEQEIRDSDIHRVFVHIFDVFDFRAERFWWRRGFRSVNGTGELEKLLK